jgi:peroxiredoxin
LADFQGTLSEFTGRGVTVVAGSVDSLDHARRTVADLGLRFPVAFGLNAAELSSTTGAFYEGEKKYLHATAFLIRPDCVVSNATYSTGSIGRLTAADALRLIDHFTKSS